MPREYSPFTPGVPVPIEFFVGRIAEVRKLVEKAGSASTGRLERAFVIGERGIGKSSLCSVARLAAETDHKMIGVHVFLGGVNSLEEMARRVFDRLLKDSVEKPWFDKVKSFLGSHVKSVGLFGFSVEFSASEEELKRLVHDFAPSLQKLVESMKDDKRGLMIVLDDINGLASSRPFADWLKSLVDEISVSKTDLPLFLVLVGLPERRSALVKSQPSLDRVFDLVEISKLSRSETCDFYEKAFRKVGIAIQPEGLDVLWEYSEGHPVFAHEIGDAVFNVNDDGIVSKEDAILGVTQSADIIGRKYLEPQVLDAIRSPRYRAILRKLARETVGQRFERRAVIASLTEHEKKVFDNFLRKMRELGVLQTGGGGDYRFTSELQHLYFGLEARRAEESK